MVLVHGELAGRILGWLDTLPMRRLWSSAARNRELFRATEFLSDPIGQRQRARTPGPALTGRSPLAAPRSTDHRVDMVAAVRVLVTYASAAGSTGGVAERIVDTLRISGCEVVCRPVGPDVDPAGFDAVVVGSAVHNMAWLPSAVEMMGRAASVRCPVWCFSVGGVNPRGRFTWYVARKEAERVERQFPAGATVRDHRVFGGVVEMRGVPLWGRLVYRLTGARAGDNRDWPAIESWARNIAAAVTTVPASNREAVAQYRPPTPPAGW